MNFIGWRVADVAVRTMLGSAKTLLWAAAGRFGALPPARRLPATPR
jgi:hypothetical protein